MKHSFQIGDVVMALRPMAGSIRAKDIFTVTSLVLEPDDDNNVQQWIGFSCSYEYSESIAMGTEPFCRSDNFKLISRGGKRDYTCRSPKNLPAIGAKLP